MFKLSYKMKQITTHMYTHARALIWILLHKESTINQSLAVVGL